MPVEVFKTNVVEPSQASLIVGQLVARFPEWKVNFDLHDCDKVLRVEGPQVSPGEIIEFVVTHGFDCEVLS